MVNLFGCALFCGCFVGGCLLRIFVCLGTLFVIFGGRVICTCTFWGVCVHFFVCLRIDVFVLFMSCVF